MRNSNVEYTESTVIVRRCIGSMMADAGTALFWIAGLLATLLVGSATPLSLKSVDFGILRSPFMFPFIVPLGCFTALLSRHLINFLKWPNYVIDLQTGLVCGGARRYGSIDEISDVSVESSVPSGFKVQYRTVVRFKSGEILLVAISPVAPTILDVFTQGNPFGQLRGVTKLKWVTNADYADPDDNVFQEMEELKMRLSKILADYKLISADPGT